MGWWGIEAEDVHHRDCHYDAGYCDGTLCWAAAENDARTIAAIARHEECPVCGLACDGDCDEEDEKPGHPPDQRPVRSSG